MADNRSPHPSLRRYPPELRERAVRMVLETIEQTGERFGVITRVARQLGIGSDAGGYATLISDTGSGRCWAVRGGGASLIQKRSVRTGVSLERNAPADERSSSRDPE